VSLVAFGLLGAVTVAGALAVLFARETMRLIMGLGAFLLGIAGLYLYYAMPLLAAAQVFLYVGGVLVLFIFAIMALRRGPDGRTQLTHRFDIGAATVSVGLFVLIVGSLTDLASSVSETPVAAGSVAAVGDLLMGPLLAQFELAGGLLLIALVAAIAIAGQEGER
jgi:NADH:ubiquinone oxidoreductase subunit 6 (subunit J)